MKTLSLLLLGFLFLFFTTNCSNEPSDPVEPDFTLENLLVNSTWQIKRLDGEQLGLIFDGTVPLPVSFDYLLFAADSTDCRLDDFMEFQSNGNYSIRSGNMLCSDSAQVITEGLWDISLNGDTLNLRDPENILLRVFYAPSSNALYKDFTFDPEVSPLDFLQVKVSDNQDTLQFIHTFSFSGVDVLLEEPASLNTEIRMELVRQN